MVGRWMFFSSVLCLALTPMARAPIAMATERLPADDAKTVFLTGHVTAIIDGQTVALNQGDQLRLVGIDIPPGENDKAMAALKSLVGGREVQLVSAGPQRDRWRRLVAQVVRTDGLWIQGQLVRDGIVRVAGDADHRRLLTELLHLEDQARQDHAGIWANKDFQPHRAGFMPRATGSFEIVEGTVISAAIVGGRGYLNFGEDRRRDFTVAAEPEILRVFTKSGIDWQGYQGRQVRVRGHVGFFDGPRIDVTYPEQIELMEKTPSLAIQPQRMDDPSGDAGRDPSEAERP